MRLIAGDHCDGAPGRRSCIALAALLAGTAALAMPAFCRAESAASARPNAERSAGENFAAGRFAEAARAWRAEADARREVIDPRGEATALLGVAAADERLGDYAGAEAAARRAAGIAPAAGRVDAALTLAQVLTLMRSDAMGMSRLPEAGQWIERAAADGSASPRQRARAMAARANWLLAGRDSTGAAAAYREAMTAARDAGDDALAARCGAGAALALRAQAPASADEAAAVEATSVTTAPASSSALAQAAAMNGRALELIPSDAAPDHDTAYLLLTIGQTWDAIGRATNDAATRGRADAADRRALRMAEALGDPLARSYANGQMAALYEQERRVDEARRLNARALFDAQRAGDRGAVARWQGQAGRLLAEAGRRNDAIAALGDAVVSLRGVQSDLAAGGGNDPSRPTFRAAAGDVYYELADLLLARAAGAEDADARQADLLAARQTVEQLKTAELQNYFEDRCDRLLQERRKSIDVLDAHTAVVYFVPLPDRLEILVSTAAGGAGPTTRETSGAKMEVATDRAAASGHALPANVSAAEFGATRRDGARVVQFTAAVPSAELTAVARDFRRDVRDTTTYAYDEEGRKLYKWLIAPVEAYLASAGAIDTLVFVPDGALRSIPMAALVAPDGKFLIERYAVAVSPGLSLTDTRARGSRARQDMSLLVNGLSVERTVDGETFPALSHVDEEVGGIGRLYGPRNQQTLLNQDFVISRVDDEMRGRPFSVVHIASHGEFGGNVHDTFVLTYGGKMDLDQLEQLIEPGKFRDKPVDLLTLSACETAAGDDRAALGLAGIAVKAGALSALATLWSVDDLSSATLVGEFYKGLRTATKAQALQSAQRALLADPKGRFTHPYYWSPYLIVGNWL